MAQALLERRLDSRVKIAWLLPVYVLAFVVFLLAALSFVLLPGEETSLVASMSNSRFVVVAFIVVELLLLVPSFLWAQVRYSAFTYSFGKDELIVRDGIITRQRIVVPYERIQRVSTERTLRERLLSLTTLRIETAARDALKFSATLPGIANEERDGLIAEIMSNVVRKKGGQAGLGTPVEEEGDGGDHYGALLVELRRIRELLEKQGTSSLKDERMRKGLEKLGRLHDSLKDRRRKEE